MKKFNKFDLVYEAAIKSLLKEENAVSDQNHTGKFGVGCAIRLKPSFFTQSETAEGLDSAQLDALKAINSTKYEKNTQHFFKVKTVKGADADSNVKSANNINRANLEYEVISAAEKDNNMYKFMLCGCDLKHIEVIPKDEINLMPVLSPETKYSYHNAEAGRPTPVNDKDFEGIGNSPKDRTLRQK